MSYCTQDILLLAQDIYIDLGQPSNLSIGYISGYITSPGTLGDLNNKLNGSFTLTGVAPCIADPFAAEEAAVLESMFKIQYYQQQSLAALANGGSFWTSLSEGDTRVSRVDAVKISKGFLDLKTDALKELRLQIHDYNLRLSVPQQVVTAGWNCLPPTAGTPPSGSGGGY